MDRHTPAPDASYYGGQYMTPAHYVNRSQEEDGEERLNVHEHGGVTECLREQDIYLPIANIGRIMNNAIPESLKTSKDAKDTVQECVSEFISFVTSEASDRCIHEKRKTISGEDILYALSALGFDAYVDPMKLFLQKFREFRREAKGLAPGGVSVGEEGLGDGEELPDNGFTNPLPAGIATADGQQQNAMVYTNNTSPYQQAPAVEQTQFPRQEISPPAPSATAATAAHDATVPKGPAVTDHQV